MKRYVTRVPNSDHYIYKIGLGTYDILKNNLSDDKRGEILNDFLDMGGNLIDTSRYDLGERKGDVEGAQKFIGSWISKNNRRKTTYLVANTNCLLSDNSNKEEAFLKDLNESLNNLNTDCIDLFIINGDDEKTEVSLILNMLSKAKESGKILNYGCSNFKSYRIRQAMEYARDNNLQGFSVNQMLFNIGSSYIDDSKISSSYIKMDEEMFNIHKEFNILAMPYSSFCNGFFSKLYLEETEEGSVDINELKESPYYTKENFRVYEEMKLIGSKYIASPGWVALGYLFNQSIDTCSILSVDSIGQLKEAFEAIDRKYTIDDFSNIDMFNKKEILV